MRTVVFAFVLAASLICWIAVARHGEIAAVEPDEGAGTEQLQRLEIRVRTSDGAPGTELRALLVPAATLLHSERREVLLTSRDGRYVIDGLSPGSWEISPVAGPWRVVQPRGRLSFTIPTKHALEFVAEAPGALTVLVEDAFGEGLAGVQVEALAQGLPPHVGETDSEGLHTFGALPTGDVRVSARRGELTTQRRSFVPSRAHHRLALAFPGGGVLGHVLDETGRAAGGLRVGLRPARRGPAWTEETTADHEGAFHFRLVQPGLYDVGVVDADEAVAVARAEVLDGRTAEVSITVKRDRSATVSGRLFAGSRAVGDTDVVFVRAGDGTSAMDLVRVRTNADGRFLARLSEPGTWAALGQLPGRRAIELERVDVAAGVPVRRDLVFPTGQIVGRVRAPGGHGLVGARVEAIDERGWALGSMRPEQVTTASDGSFEVDGLLPGRWVLHVTPQDLSHSAIRSHPLEITRADPEAFVDLQAIESGTLRVTFASEALVTGDSFAVYVRDAKGGLAFPRPRIATGTRELEVRGLPPGTYRAIAVGEGRVSTWSEPARVTSGEEARTSVELRPAGWLDVSLGGVRGATLDRVELFATDGNGASILPWATLAPKAGALLVGPLPPDDYALHATSVEGSKGRVQASVRAGETSKARLELR